MTSVTNVPLHSQSFGVGHRVETEDDRHIHLFGE